MTTYKPVNKKCPHCHETFEFMEIMSHNTFFTTFWTDGRRFDALRSFNGMFECLECSSFFWKRDAIEVEEEPYSDEAYIKKRLAFIDKMLNRQKEDETDSQNDYQNIHDITFPRMFEFLSSPNITSKEDEYYVRKMIWWTYNDCYRELYPHEETYTKQKEDSLLVQFKEKNIENMQALIDLVELTCDEEILTKAELYRQLGLFDECISLLQSCTSNELKSAKSIIHQHAVNENRYVQQLT